MAAIAIANANAIRNFIFSLRPLSADALDEGRRQEEAATRREERWLIKYNRDDNEDGDGDDDGNDDADDYDDEEEEATIRRDER